MSRMGQVIELRLRAHVRFDPESEDRAATQYVAMGQSATLIWYHAIADTNSRLSGIPNFEGQQDVAGQTAPLSVA